MESERRESRPSVTSRCYAQPALHLRIDEGIGRRAVARQAGAGPQDPAGLREAGARRQVDPRQRRGRRSGATRPRYLSTRRGKGGGDGVAVLTGLRPIALLAVPRFSVLCTRTGGREQRNTETPVRKFGRSGWVMGRGKQGFPQGKVSASMAHRSFDNRIFTRSLAASGLVRQRNLEFRGRAA